MLPDGPQCQWLLAVPERWQARWWRRLRRCRPELTMCGLYGGHTGAHAPFVAGEYLRPPIIHPLQMPFRWGPWQCPEGCPTCSVYTEGPVHDIHHDGTGWVLHDVAMQWEFQPCQHTFRTICPRPDDPGQPHGTDARRKGGVFSGRRRPSSIR